MAVERACRRRGGAGGRIFREVVREVYTLAEVARRLDASLARTLDASQAHSSRSREEFVTAVLAEIDPAPAA